MAMYDLHNNIQILGDKVNQITDNTAQVVSVDTLGFLALEFLVSIGNAVDADVTFTVLVEDSADNSTWAAVADDFLIGTEAGAGLIFSDDNKTAKIGYVGKKRYCRITTTPANNTGAADISTLAIGAFPLNAPKSAQIV